MPEIPSSYERFWTSVRQSWHDDRTPYRVTRSEWDTLIRPQLEAKKDLTPETLKQLDRFTRWGSVEQGARTAAGSWLRLEAPKYTPAAGGRIDLPPKRGHRVSIDPAAGFVNPAGVAPTDPKKLTDLMWHAGEWLQASFGSKDNMFTALDAAGKSKVLAQFSATQNADLRGLPSTQRDQLLGTMAALTVELMKSIDVAELAPANAAAQRQVRDDAFAVLDTLLSDSRISKLIRRELASYAEQNRSLATRLTAPQKSRLDAIHDGLVQKRPFDYAAWDAAGKSTIVIDHASGLGEGFLYGFVKAAQGNGLGDARGNFDNGSLKFQLVNPNADTVNGPATLRVVVPRNHALNAWGRDMTIELRLREFRTDMYKAMGDASVDIVSYGGHSNFGGNTLRSLPNAPAQVGEKVIARDLCAGSDTRNAEAHVYPDASSNSITSVSSTYFRTRRDPQVGEYAYESEGYEMLMALTRGVLGKKEWGDIGPRLPNWYGHDTTNNWTWPGDPRGSSFVDLDGDGIPNVFDLIPSYNTTKVAESTAQEFALRVPETPFDEISGERAFQAIQFVNTATNYNPVLQYFNSGRKLHGHPNGVWFDGTQDPALVKLSEAADGTYQVQMSSRLAAMSIESLRAVLYFEMVRFANEKDARLFRDNTERNAMALLFVAASIEYDQSSRDRAVFDGIKKIYGIPAAVDFYEVHRIIMECDTKRHNYTGDQQGMRDVVAKYSRELGGQGAGEPVVPANNIA